MTARGASLASPGNDAPDATLLQLAADPLGCRLIGDGRGLDAIVDPLVAEIGTDRRCRKSAEEVGVLPLDPLPFLTRGVLATHRAELQPSSARWGSRRLRRWWLGRRRLARCRGC